MATQVLYLSKSFVHAHRRKLVSGKAVFVRQYSAKGRKTAAHSKHGHVFPNPDGSKARCGGPALCSECAADLKLKQAGV